MATPRLTMKNIREILRQKWVLQRTHRDIASSKMIGLGTITKITDSSKRAGLTWEAVQELSDAELEKSEMDDLVDALDKATPGSPEAIAVRRELVQLARRAQASGHELQRQLEHLGSFARLALGINADHRLVPDSGASTSDEAGWQTDHPQRGASG